MSKPGDPSIEQRREHGPIGDYLFELAELADVAAQAQGEGDADTAALILPVLQTLAERFAEPAQITRGVPQQAEYQAQAETLPADSAEQFVAEKVSQWLALCTQILASGVDAATLSLKIKRVLTPERLAGLGVELAAPVAAPRESTAERRERGYQYEIGYATEVSTSHPDINEDAVLIDEDQELFAVFDGTSNPPGGNVAALYAQKFIQRELKNLASTLSPADVKLAMVNVLKQANDYINHLKLSGTVPVNVRDKVTHQYHTEQRPFDNTVIPKLEHRAGTTAAVVKMWHGPSGERKAIIGHVGDSRVYKRKVDGTIELLTIDHGDREIVVARKKQLLSEEQFIRLLKRFGRIEKRQQFSAPEEQAFLEAMHYIDQGLGGFAQIEPSVQIIDLAEGEELLLTTDGVHDQISDTTLENLMNVLGSHDMNSTAKRIVQRAKLAGEQRLTDLDARGKGPDDATAIWIREVKMTQGSAAKRTEPTAASATPVTESTEPIRPLTVAELAARAGVVLEQTSGNAERDRLFAELGAATTITGITDLIYKTRGLDERHSDHVALPKIQELEGYLREWATACRSILPELLRQQVLAELGKPKSFKDGWRQWMRSELAGVLDVLSNDAGLALRAQLEEIFQRLALVQLQRVETADALVEWDDLRDAAETSLRHRDDQRYYKTWARNTELGQAELGWLTQHGSAYLAEVQQQLFDPARQPELWRYHDPLSLVSTEWDNQWDQTMATELTRRVETVTQLTDLIIWHNAWEASGLHPVILSQGIVRDASPKNQPFAIKDFGNTPKEQLSKTLLEAFRQRFVELRTVIAADVDIIAEHDRQGKMTEQEEAELIVLVSRLIRSLPADLFREIFADLGKKFAEEE